jgi:hypothetical protein
MSQPVVEENAEHNCWWREEFESIREGSDPTPPDPGSPLTAEQLWFRLLISHQEDRTRLLLMMQAAGAKAQQCLLQDHEGMAEVLAQMTEALAAVDRENRALRAALTALVPPDSPTDV